jgi:preprotein translocase subunit YajC
MHILLASLLESTPSTTVAKATSTSGSLTPFLVLILIFGGAYLLFIRPRSKRARAQQIAARQVGVGDAVMTAGGIFGTVVEVTPDSVAVEVSPGVIMTFIPKAVSARPSSAGSPPPPVRESGSGYGQDGQDGQGGQDDDHESDSGDEPWSEGTDPPERPGSPRA